MFASGGDLWYDRKTFSDIFRVRGDISLDGSIIVSQIKLFGGGGSHTRARAAGRSGQTERPVKKHSGLKALSIVLIVLAVLEGLYFTAVYSRIPFVAKWRNIYIQTAMSTMRHQWLATYFIPRSVINGVMTQVEAAQKAQVGVNTSWKSAAETSAGSTDEADKKAAEMAGSGMTPDQIAFYELFWEIDQTSMESYVKLHPDVVSGGWNKIKINQSGLNDDGTDIQTTMGEQVLAIDAENEVLLVRVKGDNYRGVLAIAKDPSRLSVKNSRTLGSAGQYAGTIAQNNGGILAMTANGFIDPDGKGNGGILAGYTMSDGDGTGSHMGWSYKRLELRSDDRMYIVDAQSPVNEATTDAVEFTPALIVDSKVLVDANCGWTAVNPRACIGQSEKGEVLMLVIEGRLIGYSLGTGVVECADILQQHKCAQAMNLDGGTSAILWYDGAYVTRCSNQACPEGRPLPNAFVYSGN